MKKRMNRRDFLRLSAAATAGGILAACQSETVEVTREVEKIVKETVVETVKETVIVEGTPQTVEVTKEVVKEVMVTAPPPETVELRLAEGSWVGPEGIAFWTDEIIPRFEAENPTIEVTFENAEAPDYGDKLYTQAVAGDAPDVMFVWGGLNYNLMQKGQFLELDDHIEKELLDDFYPGKLDAHYYEGHLYGLPKYVSTIALAYNRNLLDEAGVDYPDGTWDWDDYRNALEATTDPENGQWGTYVGHTYLEHWVWMNGGEVMNADLFGTQSLLNEPKAMEALKFNYDLIYGENPVSPKPGEIPEYGIHSVFTTGKIAFVEAHSWTVTNYMRESDFQWDFADLPVARDGGKAGLTFADGYGIAAKTKHPNEAITLAKFMVSPWAEKAMAMSIVGLQPTRRSMAEVWDTLSLGAQAGYDVGAFSRIMDYARLDPAFEDNEKINEIMNPIWDQIWVTGEMGLEEGVDLIVQRIDDYFAG
jgi:multiple sugar transport system substrate-binding protein